MHFEFLIEDRSGKDALNTLIPKIIESSDTFRIHSYRGIGRLPGNLRSDPDPKKRMLLTQLPRLLQGYALTYRDNASDFEVALVCICDLDRRCRHDFRLELLELAKSIQSRVECYFCIAEEEGEAWFLGDPPAITTAYPLSKRNVLDNYVPDSICGTWETLADAVITGGSKSLKGKKYYEIGAAKCKWANDIPRHMNVEVNSSPSFCYLRDKLRMISNGVGS